MKKKQKFKLIIQHQKTNSNIPYPTIERETQFVLPLAIPYGNETQKDAQKRLVKKTKLNLIQDE